ncbi:MAG: hypothetical protein ACKVYV_08510 [Limisphaerales bacterium]
MIRLSVARRFPTAGRGLLASVLLAAGLPMTIRSAWAQASPAPPDPAADPPAIGFPLIGKVKPRSTDEIARSNRLLGCETLDRDFADYDQYKEFIAPLGIKRLRMQAGWNKTERVKGEHDFAWLDQIVNDAVRRGFQPWLQTSYGNTLYPGAGMPTSPEALAAYDRWVTALVTRYRDTVSDWEVWNEPNFGDNTANTPELTADFNIRTAEIIKRIQPHAKISGLALGHYNRRFFERFCQRLAASGKFGVFDNLTDHDYAYNPDGNQQEVAEMNAELARYTDSVKLRQGENGAPSAGGAGRGARWDYDWTELTQAKWNTRRMLGNLGHDLESSLFSLVEMAYASGPINRLNYKGLLKSDESKRVIRPQLAYHAVQHVTSVFDDSLERIRDLQHTHNLAGADPDAHRYTHTTDRKVAVYGYRHKTSGKQIYSFWLSENIPADSNVVKRQEFSSTKGNFDNPVLVDVISGNVYGIPAAQWSRTGDTFTFKGIPLYDAPVLIADRSLIRVAR